MSRPPRRPTSAPRRAPPPRGARRPVAQPSLRAVAQALGEALGSVPAFAQVTDVDTEKLAHDVLDSLASHFPGGAEAATDAVHDAVNAHAALSNLSFRQGKGLGLSDRLAIGVLWHLYLLKHGGAEQVALQSAAATVAGWYMESSTSASPAQEGAHEGCGDPTCARCAPRH